MLHLYTTNLMVNPSSCEWYIDESISDAHIHCCYLNKDPRWTECMEEDFRRGGPHFRRCAQCVDEFLKETGLDCPEAEALCPPNVKHCELHWKKEYDI